MTPPEFKSRYLEGLRAGFRHAPEEVWAKLEERLTDFFTYPGELLERSSLPQKEMEFLGQVGLPREAAPGLNFTNLYEIQPRLENHPFFKDYFPLGMASEGRLVVIDKETGYLLFFDLSEEDLQPALVNSSLEKFAECLCLFQEYRDRNDLDSCMDAMRDVDPMLREYYGFWDEEVEGFFENVLKNLNEAAARKSGE